MMTVPKKKKKSKYFSIDREFILKNVWIFLKDIM